MNRLFVDTGYMLALEVSNDENHARALRDWRSRSQTFPQLITTTFVLAELVTFLNSRGFHEKAVKRGNSLLSSKSIHLIHVDEKLLRTGWEYFQKHADKQYSLTDCISFVVMHQHDISSALAFDKHFSQAEFIREPRQ